MSIFLDRIRAGWWSWFIALLVLAPLARADGDEHWTTNGIHKGIIGRIQLASSFDPKYLGGSYKFSYALWTLMGEPLESSIFVWKWPDDPAWSSLVVGTAKVDGGGKYVKVVDLKRHPDLLERFRNLKPINIELDLSIQFFVRDSIGGWILSSYGSKSAKPDLIGNSGQQLDSLIPSSPVWEDFFRLNGERENYYSDSKVRTQRNKAIFHRAERVHLEFGSPAIKSIEWPEYEWREILKEFGERESKTIQKTNQVAQATNAPPVARTNALPSAVTQTNPPRPSTGPNPLDPHSTQTAENPLDPHPRPALTGKNPLDPRAGTRGNPIERGFLHDRRLKFENDIAQARQALAELAQQEPQMPSREIYLTVGDPTPEQLAEFKREMEAKFQRKLAAYRSGQAEWEKRRQQFLENISKFELQRDLVLKEEERASKSP